MDGNHDQSDHLKRIMLLRCARCTICIGPGYVHDEIWYDPKIRKRVCRACAEDYFDNQCILLVTREELHTFTGGTQLVQLLREREAALGRKRTEPNG